MDAAKPTSVVVVGAGPAGYPAAFHAADMGMKVTLVDAGERPGGVCLHRGCIPSKALLHAAAVVNDAREASDMGLSFSAPVIDLDRLREWKQSIIDKLTGGLSQLAQRRGVEHVQGVARFTGPGRLVVETADGERPLPYEHLVLAPGSLPATIPMAEDSPRVLDSTGALALGDIPPRLLVIGGGYIGLELGQVYAALGSSVSVVEMMPSLLPGVDPELVRPLARKLGSQFEAIMLETRVADMREARDGLTVRFEGENAVSPEQTFDKVLVAVGRKPNTSSLGIEHTEVAVGAGGFFLTDSQKRTADPAIFSVGDAAGQPMLAHKGTAEARVAVDAIAGKKTVFDPAAIPAVVFTDPEIAWCGLTEDQAREAGRDVKVSRFPWAASGRAMTMGFTAGLTKLVADADGRILGVGLAGHGAGELIAEGVLAVEMGAVSEDLALTVHAHPTLSETLMEAAELFTGRSVHFVGRG